MHLKGPWKYRILPAAEQMSPPDPEIAAEGRIKLPAAWEECFGTYRGTVRYQRHFNCPTNLDSHEQVFVIFTEIGGQASIRLNGSELGTAAGGPGPFEFEITTLLQSQNMLEADVTFQTADPSPGGLWSPVALEIRSD